MRRRIEITLLMWICTCCLLVARPLAGQLDSLLSVTPLMRTSEAGIAVYDLTAGTSVYRHQAGKLYRPASVEKVITSVTACLFWEPDIHSVRNWLIPEPLNRTP